MPNMMLAKVIYPLYIIYGTFPIMAEHLKLSLKQHEAYHQQLVMDYKRGLGKLGQEKHTLAQQAMQEFPHDPDHPGGQ